MIKLKNNKKAFYLLEFIVIIMFIGMILGLSVKVLDSYNKDAQKIKEMNIQAKEMIVENEKFTKQSKEYINSISTNKNKIEDFSINKNNESKFFDEEKIKKEKEKEIIKDKNDKFLKFILNGFLFFIGLIFVMFLLKGLLSISITLIEVFNTNKNKKLEKEKEEKDIELYDLNKYVNKSTFKYKTLELNRLNDIDKNLIKDLINLLKNDSQIKFIKDQLHTLYWNSYNVLKQLDDLTYVVNKFKENNTYCITDDEKKLLLENENNIRELNDKFKKNLSTYNYILLQIPKLNNGMTINDISLEIKNFITNVIDLNKPNQELNDLMKKYTD